MAASRVRFAMVQLSRTFVKSRIDPRVTLFNKAIELREGK
jgi:hypothetical protein